MIFRTTVQFGWILSFFPDSFPGTDDFGAITLYRVFHTANLRLFLVILLNRPDSLNQFTLFCGKNLFFWCIVSKIKIIENIDKTQRNVTSALNT